MDEIDHDDECTCGVPANATVVSVVTLVRYMDDNGDMFRADLSHDAAGEPLTYDEFVSLVEWGKMLYGLPMIAEMLGFECLDEEDE